MMMDYQDGWSSIESSQGNYSLTQMKAEYAWTRANGIGMAWDGALYHASIPSYISGLSGQAGAAAWVNFIQAVAAACPNIEVIVGINEYLEFKYTLGALPAFLTYINGIAPWNGISINNTYDSSENEAWVVWAVSVLHQYFPNSTIVTEEYNCESQTQSYDSAHQAVINIALACKPYGLGGIGMEGFFGQDYFSPSAADLLAGMNDFKNQVGLPVYITSLVYSSSDDNAQLAMAQSLTPAILSNGNCAMFQLYYFGANLTQYGGDPAWDWTVGGNGTPRPALTWIYQNVQPFASSTNTVPNVVGDTQAAASSAITGAGLTVGTITKQVNGAVPVGDVISQTPVAGTSEPPGTLVNLVISIAPQTSYIQSNTVAVTNASSAHVSFTSPNAAGNCLVVCGSILPGATASITITDSNGNAYTIACQAVNAAANRLDFIAVAFNAKAGSNAVTVNCGETAATAVLDIAEYSGLASNVIDSAGMATGSGQNLATPNIQPATSGELFISFARNSAGVMLTPGSGWTDRLLETGAGPGSIADIAASSVSQNNTVVLNNSGGQIVDASLNIWTLVGGAVLENGTVVQASGVVEIAYVSGQVWQWNGNATLGWYYWNGSAWSASGGSGNPSPLPGPPTVILAATTVNSTTSVTLNGTITSTGGQNVTIEGFKWGLTTAYGNTSSTSGSFSTGTFSQTLNGLAPNTTYHFQAFATNPNGTTSTTDGTFLTTVTAGLQFFGTGSVGGEPPNWGGSQSFVTYFDAFENFGQPTTWSNLEPNQGNYQWGAVLADYQWAQANNVTYIWHCPLYGGGSIPGWATNDANGMAAFVTFMQAAAAAMPNMPIVEVVNEPLQGYTSCAFFNAVNAISPWNSSQFTINGQPLGYVPWAVQVAHQAFPNAIIIINDFNCETSNFSDHAKYIGLLNACKPYGLGGIGLESYYGDGFDSPSGATMAAGLADFQSQVGLPVYATEGPTIISASDSTQLSLGQTIFGAYLANPNVIGISLYFIAANNAAPYQNGGLFENSAPSTMRPLFTWLISNVPLPLK